MAKHLAPEESMTALNQMREAYWEHRKEMASGDTDEFEWHDSWAEHYRQYIYNEFESGSIYQTPLHRKVKIAN